MNILTVKNLMYQDILSNINMDIKEGSIIFISGPNNCGKTTLMRILCGLIDSKNMVFYQKHDIYEFSSLELSTLFGRVIITQQVSFFFSTIDQELLSILDHLDIDEKEKKSRYKKMVKLFELDKDLYSNIDELSYDKKVRVLLVKELLFNPKILFLDQVFDHMNRNQAQMILKKLKTITNLTIVLSSSRLDLAVYSSFMYILYNHQIVLSGPSNQVLKEDSLLNKLGLELPFMNDLSVKLRYYNLVDNVELDMNRMVDQLWK